MREYRSHHLFLHFRSLEAVCHPSEMFKDDADAGVVTPLAHTPTDVFHAARNRITGNNSNLLHLNTISSVTLLTARWSTDIWTLEAHLDAGTASARESCWTMHPWRVLWWLNTSVRILYSYNCHACHFQTLVLHCNVCVLYGILNQCCCFMVVLIVRLTAGRVTDKTSVSNYVNSKARSASMAEDRSVFSVCLSLK